MAVFDHYHNMYDVKLKPRLLRSIIRDHLPDEKHPFPSPSVLSTVVSSIKTHGLLSESVQGTFDQKQIDAWKSAVDAWIERLLLLVSSKTPDKCWAGICLLGVTCQECGPDRFLASYSVWFQNLLSLIQHPPSDSHFVKVACCASLSDLFTRLGGFSNLKKDGTSHAGKLIQPILKLLTEDGSEAVWDRAVDLLCTLTSFFPSSVHRHYDSAEAAIVSKIVSGKCSVDMLKKLAQCLALLPKARGDEESWSLMMQKILISINMHLNDAFQGLEEETKCTEAIKLLVLPGKDPPPPLGGQAIGASDQATTNFEQFLMPRVCTLILCCCRMLTNPYPTQVMVPVRPLLALVGRVLLVDGSLCQGLSSFLTVMQQELICSELPVLHLYSLDLLTAIIKGIQRQLLPHAANVVRLLTEYFRRCALPAIRIKVYSVVRILLVSMGIGMAIPLVQEVINNAFADLSSVDQGSNSKSNAYAPKVSKVLQKGSHKKRKRVSGLPWQHQNGVGPEMEVLNNRIKTPISVQIAALQALEALITVGGALRSECWRPNTDLLLINVATNACDGGWSNEEKNNTQSDEPSTRADFQLAALRALLASLLSPAHVRPPYLSQGLELFRRGKQETGTKLAEFCAHALMTLEVLIHPRALPMSEYPSGNHGRFPDGGQKPDTPFSRGALGVDDLYQFDDLDSWIANGEEIGPQVSYLDKQIENFNDPSGKNVKLAVDGSAEQLLGDVLASAEFPAEEILGSVESVTVEAGNGDRDVVMVEPERTQVPVFADGVAILARNETALSGGATVSSHVLPRTHVTVDTSNAAEGAIVSAGGLLVSSKGKEPKYSSDSDLDSLPDIVDGDPDSD